MSRLGAILVAAGSGERLGVGRPKALVELAGRPLVCLAYDGLVTIGADPVVVVAPPDRRGEVAAALAPAPSRVVAGGATRADSVRAGLAVLPDGVDLVAVHDAARPLTPVETMRAAVQALLAHEDVVAAAPALPVTDTLKRVRGDEVIETVDRSDLVAVQTPQVFRRPALAAAHRDSHDATDDLTLVENLLRAGRLSGRIVVTPGSAYALKITFAHDLTVAAALTEATP